MTNTSRIGRAALSTIALLLLGGCIHYTPVDLDLERFAREWSERTVRELDPTAVASAFAEVGRNRFAPDDGLDRAEAEIVALAYNPALAVARLETVGAARAADVAGRWADPELSVDVLRYLEATDEPWLLGAMIGFEVPLSGSKAAERRAAGAAADEARARLVLAEHDLLARLGTRWITWWTAVERGRLVGEASESLDELLVIARRLAAASAIPGSDLQVLELESLALADRRRALAARAAADRRGLLALLGLSPDADVVLAPAPAIVEPDAVRLATDAVRHHPRLRLAEARLETADRDLRRELAKQYPDLLIGPRVQDEDGQTRLGLGFGIPLPLWNRNIHGITRAAAERDAAKAAVEATYVALVADYRSATMDRHAARARRDALDQDFVARSAQHVAALRRIAELGDLDVLRLADAVSRALGARERLLDATADVARATHRLVVLARRAVEERRER